MNKIESMTMKEISIVEQKSGLSISAMEDPNAQKGLLLTALAWVVKKRDIATFSWEEAENLTLPEVLEVLGLDQDDDENLSG